MTPKEKAEQIVNELFERTLAYHDAVIAAKFLAEEMLNEIQGIISTYTYIQPNETSTQSERDRENFWQEVSKEIENL